MKIVIAGETPFIEAVSERCRAAGHDVVVYLVEDFMAAVQSGHAMREAVDADVVIELHHESAAAKQELLLALSSIIPEDALLLTSALNASTTQTAAWSHNVNRVVGFGLFPPIAADGLVEMAAGLRTPPEAIARATAFWQGIGLEPLQVADGPGLVRGRIVCCLINEATSALMEGVATPADIDLAMRLGTNYPIGPLAWGDEVGLDAVLGVMTALFEEWGEDRYRPSPLLRRMVLAGRLGKKTGEGFYQYER